MADLFTKEYNTRTRFTRMCIGEALFVLLDQKEYGQIRISDIVKRAGVSRMTFYHYYDTKEEAVQDYFHEIVKEYVWEVERSKGKLGHFHDRSSIMYALSFFDQYADFILKIVHAGLYSIVIDAMNTYLIEKIRPVYHIPDYELYFYGGALLNVFIPVGRERQERNRCPNRTDNFRRNPDTHTFIIERMTRYDKGRFDR